MSLRIDPHHRQAVRDQPNHFRQPKHVIPGSLRSMTTKAPPDGLSTHAGPLRDQGSMESLAGGRVRIRVAIADVDALVRKTSAIDDHAALNTTSVYTPAIIFPMLPEALSTGLTSLNEDQDRVAVVADLVFEQDGSLAAS